MKIREYFLFKHVDK